MKGPQKEDQTLSIYFLCLMAIILGDFIAGFIAGSTISTTAKQIITTNHLETIYTTPGHQALINCYNVTITNKNTSLVPINCSKVN